MKLGESIMSFSETFYLPLKLNFIISSAVYFCVSVINKEHHPSPVIKASKLISLTGNFKNIYTPNKSGDFYNPGYAELFKVPLC